MMATKPVSDRGKFDVDALAAWLAARVDDPGGVPAVEQFRAARRTGRTIRAEDVDSCLAHNLFRLAGITQGS